MPQYFWVIIFAISLIVAVALILVKDNSKKYSIWVAGKNKGKEEKFSKFYVNNGKVLFEQLEKIPLGKGPVLVLFLFVWFFFSEIEMTRSENQLLGRHFETTNVFNT